MHCYRKKNNTCVNFIFHIYAYWVYEPFRKVYEWDNYVICILHFIKYTSINKFIVEFIKHVFMYLVIKFKIINLWKILQNRMGFFTTKQQTLQLYMTCLLTVCSYVFFLSFNLYVNVHMCVKILGRLLQNRNIFYKSNKYHLFYFWIFHNEFHYFIMNK